MTRISIKVNVFVMGLSVILAGCGAPSRVEKYPAEALRVVYEDATTPSSCLVASVAMAANYLLGEREFSEALMLHELDHRDLNATSVGDLKEYLGEKGLHMVTLSGRMSDTPPTGLGYWLKKRGYPVVCVINDEEGNPELNHAVVVIGIWSNPETGSVDTIHYFDPSSVEALHSIEAATFETRWARGQHAMMIVIKPPFAAKKESG
ncbi:MAG: hypothetical protein JSV03_14065 [Planctomycetota bacterium]|nr:MAG: hypothetical protein JSV03_14065 [Planctomycetota bacterium]